MRFAATGFVDASSPQLTLDKVAPAEVKGAAASAFGLVMIDALSPSFARRIHGRIGPPLRPVVRPEDLESQAVRASYQALLTAHEDLRLSLASDNTGVVEVLRDLFARCGELVESAGRLAKDGDRLSAYLDGQSVSLQDTATQLQRLGASARDADAARAYGHAAAMRRQQIDLNQQIRGLYDRVEGRLAAALAFLGVLRALVVKLRALGDVQANGATIADSVSELRSELELLETSLEKALTDESLQQP